MTLPELAALSCASQKNAAPDWMVGCFRRQSITFYTGAVDTATKVYWLQARGLCADIRIPTHSPVEVEGSVSETAWDGEMMRWSPGASFQVHPRWPEPGLLRRVGDCMIEFAPSGAYVEDWRFEPSRPGPLIGLKLVREYNLDTGVDTHCGGGLIVCGEHAALVLGRPKPLPACGRVSELLRGGGDELLREVFSCEASYALFDKEAASFTIALSTHRARHGESLAILDGYAYNPDMRLITQRVLDQGVWLERTFVPDTLESSFDFASATPVGSEAAEWLAREALI